MKKKLLASLLAAAMVLGLAACGGNSGGSSSSGDSGNSGAYANTDNAGNAGSGNQDQTPSGNAPTGSYTVGICQLAPHPALDAATRGFKDALNTLLPAQVTFNEQNAAGESSTGATIINGFVSDNVDLILANATSPLQDAASTPDIPILGIEDFISTDSVSIDMSDLAPLEQQAAMIQEWFPDAQNVGLLYCDLDNMGNSSLYQVGIVQRYLEEMGYTCTQYSFADTSTMASITQDAASNSDVIYIPTSKRIADNTDIVDEICRPLGIPIIAGDESICSGCGVATLFINSYDIGYKTGEMAAQILTGEADISTMPIEYAPQITRKYNEAICSDLGLTPPEGYEAITAE